jgi:uncharacterized protein (TIGR02246 family)
MDGEANMDVGAVAEKFCAGWTSLDAEAFSMLFAPEGHYTDIAFGITRRGRDQVREHHRIWRTALPEFVMLNEHAYVSGSAVIVKTVCYGMFRVEISVAASSRRPSSRFELELSRCLN